MEACHTPEKFNDTSFTALAVTIVTLEAFAGMWINAFIVSVISMIWVKKKSLNSNEKILLVLGFSRFWYLCIGLVFFFLSIIYSQSGFVYHMYQLIESAGSFFNCSNLWVSACLCVFYCIKIANIRNSFFIYLKVKIDSIVPWLLLGSLFISLLAGILVTDKALMDNFNLTCQGIIWRSSIRMDEHFFSTYFIIGFLFATAFMVVAFSALLLLFSLWRHKRNMQTNCMKDLSMDAHIKAMKCIVSFLVMYSINFLSLLFTLVYSMKDKTDVRFLIYLIQYAFPGVHSLILIFSNPKLEKTMLRILPAVKSKFCMK